MIVVVCQSANTAERIEVLLVAETLGNLRSTVFDGSPDFPFTDSMRPSPNYFGFATCCSFVMNWPCGDVCSRVYRNCWWDRCRLHRGNCYYYATHYSAQVRKPDVLSRSLNRC